MRVYLVQHGDAVPKEVDPDRPLSDTGRQDIERLAKFLNRIGRTTKTLSLETISGFAPVFIPANADDTTMRAILEIQNGSEAWLGFSKGSHEIGVPVVVAWRSLAKRLKIIRLRCSSRSCACRLRAWTARRPGSASPRRRACWWSPRGATTRTALARTERDTAA